MRRSGPFGGVGESEQHSTGGGNQLNSPGPLVPRLRRRMDVNRAAPDALCRFDAGEERLALGRIHQRIPAQVFTLVDQFPACKYSARPPLPLAVTRASQRGEPSSTRDGELTTPAVLGVPDADCLTLGNLDTSRIRPAVAGLIPLRSLVHDRSTSLAYR